MAEVSRTQASLPFVNGTAPHLPCGIGDIERDVLLPGDPDRVEMLSEFLEKPRRFGRRREYAVVSGIYEGHPITICSSGIGGPSTEIALVELRLLGAHRVVRIGGMSTLVLGMDLGGFFVPDMALGDASVAQIYFVDERSYAPDDALSSSLLRSAGELGLTVTKGKVATTDSYYVGQDRPTSWESEGSVGTALLSKYRDSGALGIEMETQVVFSVSRKIGLQAASLLAVRGSRASNAWLDDYQAAQHGLLRIAGRAFARSAESANPQN